MKGQGDGKEQEEKDKLKKRNGEECKEGKSKRQETGAEENKKISWENA